jgi:aryl-alcohol dehydrogenase-like predicted oxidoreductase
MNFMSDGVKRNELTRGFSVARVLTGLWQIADMERGGRQLDLNQIVSAMVSYVDAGFTTFDMADHYGSAEEIAGRFLQEQNSNIELLTKWVPKPGPKTKEDVRAAVCRSLKRMKSDRLDLLQFHTWDYADPNWLDNLHYLQELRQEGLIRFLGLTNFNTKNLHNVISSGIKIISNQVCFSLLDQRAKGDMTRLCQKYGIKLLAFGIVAGGFFTEHWLGKSEPDGDELKTWSQMKYKRFIDVTGGWGVFQDLLSVISRVAKRLKVSVANVAGRYILEQPSVGGIIIGARLGKSEHINDNLRVFQFSLDDRSVAEIGSALEKLTPIPGDCGDEYRKPPYLTASGDLSHHI